MYRQFKDDALRNIEKEKKEPQVGEAPPDKEITFDDSHQLYVNGFMIVGNEHLGEEELHNVMQPFINRSLSTTQLHEAANTLMMYYRKKGYFAAKVFIPPHSVHDGIVTLHVYEGHLQENGIELENSEERVKSEIIMKLLESTLKPGIIKSEDYERAILLTNDLPGITTKSILFPGSEVGTANFIMQTRDEKVFNGNIDYDNFGGYYTGENRFGTTLYFNSPTKHAEELVFRFVTTGEYSNFGYIDLAVPVANNDMRIGASADYFKYKLDHEFNKVGAKGNAINGRAYMKYPFVRSRHFNVHGDASYNYTRLIDENNAGEQADRLLHTGVFRIAGNHDDDFLANGVTYFDIFVTAGNLDLDGNTLYKLFDELTAKTEGGFAKININISRLQHLYGSLSTYISLSGQIASKNLDTSQKFYLGGPYSVAGYPTGEASGDDGALFHADLRYDFYNPPWKGNLQLSAFYSYGWTNLFHDPWDGWEGTNTLITNDITLQSAGIGLAQIWSNTMVIRAMYGRQIGDNDVRNPTTGEASDGSSNDYRFWINTIFYF
jgi:hemolysin activation/secretion protein